MLERRYGRRWSMTELARKLPDTNTILRYLLDDVPHLSAKASAFFEKVRVGKEKVLILESVLAECVYVLIKFYKAPKAEVVEKLKGLLLYKRIIIFTYSALMTNY